MPGHGLRYPEVLFFGRECAVQSLTARFFFLDNLLSVSTENWTSKQWWIGLWHSSEEFPTSSVHLLSHSLWLVSKDVERDPAGLRVLWGHRQGESFDCQLLQAEYGAPSRGKNRNRQWNSIFSAKDAKGDSMLTDWSEICSFLLLVPCLKGSCIRNQPMPRNPFKKSALLRYALQNKI